MSNRKIKVVISGVAEIVTDREDDYVRPQDAVDVECDDDFADYYSGDLNLVSGPASFVYDEDSEQLMIQVEYTVTVGEKPVTSSQLNDLVEYTQGQWSDGIGEGFEQRVVDIGGHPAYISMWHQGQIANVRVEPDGP